jgi:hypothetical protein
MIKEMGVRVEVWQGSGSFQEASSKDMPEVKDKT